MYYKKFYQNLSEGEIVQKIKEEGFDPVKFSNGPGDIYSPHQHQETKLLAFLEGSMTVKVADQTFECDVADKLIIPGNIKHSAVVGDAGCTFFWSEKLL